jgi:hypothetical protein
MGSHVASIVHLSDLHLLFDEEGRVGTPSWRSQWATFFGSLPAIGEGMAGHEPQAWNALRDSLRPLIQHERRLVGSEGIVLVVQTGDVEARGGMHEGADSLLRLQGFKALFELKETVLAPTRLADGWIDIYGNHDVWRDSLGFGGPSGLDCLCGLDEFAGDWPDLAWSSTEVDLRLGGSHLLDVFRINSVVDHGRHQVFAGGAVGSHRPGVPVEKASEQLADAVGARPNDPAIRLLLMHHPPHRFRDRPRSERGHRFFGRTRANVRYSLLSRTLGDLEGRDPLAASIAGSIDLVLAGHRHSYDPHPDVTPVPWDTQRPLGDTTAQLVAQSPTKIGTSRSLPIYRLHLDELPDGGDDSAAKRLSVHRVIATYKAQGSARMEDAAFELDEQSRIPELVLHARPV